ncbi:hypothetical protein DFH29DRAFT_938703 [Suillus ampliporus]|nr:hypothetical protein DFH29DRAFT_938703 [Suillus ampliporus]
MNVTAFRYIPAGVSYASFCHCVSIPCTPLDLSLSCSSLALTLLASGFSFSLLSAFLFLMMWCVFEHLIFFWGSWSNSTASISPSLSIFVTQPFNIKLRLRHDCGCIWIPRSARRGTKDPPARISFSSRDLKGLGTSLVLAIYISH